MFVNPNSGAYGAGRQRRGVDQIDTGGAGYGSGRRGFGGPSRVQGLSSTVPNAPETEPAGGDRADLISLLASRAGVRGSQYDAPEYIEELQPAADPFADGASIVDSYIRKRATVAYRFPQQNPYGPQIDLTFDVEVAYRVIDIVPNGGQVLDLEA